VLLGWAGPAFAEAPPPPTDPAPPSPAAEPAPPSPPDEPAPALAPAPGAAPASTPAPPPAVATAPTPPAARATLDDDGSSDDDGALVTAVDIGLLIGPAVRLDEPAALAVDSRVGLRLGLGADAFLSELWAVGLHFEHVDLGRESSGIGAGGTVTVDRDLNSLWLGLRAYPFTSERIGAYINLGLAASWQSLAATGVGWARAQPSAGVPFRCEGADSISGALRAGLGVDYQVTDGLQLVSAAAFDSYRLPDDVLDGCAPGAGNASVLTAELALAYRFAPAW
jgi:opacity protein-like surface antigen